MIQNCEKNFMYFDRKEFDIKSLSKKNNACTIRIEILILQSKCLKYLCYHLSLSFEKQVQKDRQIRFAKSIKQANYKITVACIFQCDILPCNGRNTVNRDETKKSYFTADIIVHLQQCNVFCNRVYNTQDICISLVPR